MAKDPAFLFYPGDYLQDTQCLSEKSQVSYDRIMCKHMINIPISKEQLHFLTKRLNDDEKYEIMSVLKKVDGGFVIDWVLTSIEKRRAYSESRRQNRAGKSKKNINNISKSYDSHMENENEIENIDTDKNVRADIILYLNKKLNSKYKTNSQSTAKHINARLKEGYLVGDFQKVIDTKYEEWNNTEFSKFLRPETLFSSKFEGYLNQLKGEKKTAGISAPEGKDYSGSIKTIQVGG